MKNKYKLNPKIFSHQKTTLSDGFIALARDSKRLIASVGSIRLSTVFHTLLLLYHQMQELSNFGCLRGPDGIRTRIFCVENRQSAINLPAQTTKANILLQIFDTKVKLSKIRSEYE
jgi:hypothetical protein